MATKYQMQALAPNGLLVSWLADAPDFAAAFAPTLHSGGGSYVDVALTGGGIDNTGSGVPSNAFVNSSGLPFVDSSGNPFVSSS